MRRYGFVASVALSAVTLAGCFWPAPGHDADRSGHNPLERTITATTVAALQQRWVAGIGGVPSGPIDGRPGPVTSAAGVHVVDGDCSLRTFDARTGGSVWSAPVLPPSVPDYACEGLAAVEVGGLHVVGDRVEVGARTTYPVTPGPFTLYETSAHTVGFDTATGEPVSGVADFALATLRGDTIATTSATLPDLYDITLTRTTWVGTHANPGTRSLPGAVANQATLGSGRLFSSGRGPLTTTPGTPAGGFGVRAYDPAASRPGCSDGLTTQECPVWATPVDGDTWPDPVLGGGRVFTGTTAGTVYALDAATGAEAWSTPVGSAVTASPALAGGRLYVPTADGTLAVLDAENGDVLWTAATGLRLGQQPTVAGGVVYTASSDINTSTGVANGYDAAGCGAATCAPLWSASFDSWLPGPAVVSNGQLYLTTADELVAFGLP